MLIALVAVVALAGLAGGAAMTLAGAQMQPGHPEASSLMAWGVGIMVICAVVLGGAASQLLPL